MLFHGQFKAQPTSPTCTGREEEPPILQLTQWWRPSGLLWPGKAPTHCLACQTLADANAQRLRRAPLSQQATYVVTWPTTAHGCQRTRQSLQFRLLHMAELGRAICPTPIHQRLLILPKTGPWRVPPGGTERCKVQPPTNAPDALHQSHTALQRVPGPPRRPGWLL